MRNSGDLREGSRPLDYPLGQIIARSWPPQATNSPSPSNKPLTASRQPLQSTNSTNPRLLCKSPRNRRLPLAWSGLMEPCSHPWTSLPTLIIALLSFSLLLRSRLDWFRLFLYPRRPPHSFYFRYSLFSFYRIPTSFPANFGLRPVFQTICEIHSLDPHKPTIII